MEPEELKKLFDFAREAVGKISDEELNRKIGQLTNGEASDMFTLSNLVRGARQGLSPEQIEASNESVAVTTAETPGAIPRPLRGAAAGLQQFGQGVTLGGGDELAGLVSRMGEGLRPGNTAESRREAGRAGTAQSREGLRQFQDEHPVLAPALQIAGGVATGAALPGAAGFLGRAGSVPGAIARGAAIGAGEGGVAGALSGEGAGDRTKGAAIGVGLGGLLGGAAGGATGFVTRFANSLQGAGSPTKRQAVNTVRDMVDAVSEAKQTTTADLPGIVRTARSLRRGADAEGFKLAELDVFKDIADDVVGDVAQRGRLAPALAREAGVTSPGEVAGAAAIATQQAGLAGARLLGSIFRKTLAKADARKAEAIVDQLHRVLQSTDTGVQDRFIRSLLNARPVGQIGLGVPSAITGGVAVQPDAVINPLLER